MSKNEKQKREQERAKDSKPKDVHRSESGGLVYTFDSSRPVGDQAQDAADAMVDFVGKEKAAEQTGPGASPPMANGPVPPDEGQMTGDTSMGSEARIQALTSEVERLRGELSLVRSQERSDLQRDIDRAREDAKAFRADLVALDEVARGGPGKNMPVTTEMGRHLMGSIQELLRVIDIRREQALADATPVSDWSSPRAKELVEKVPPNERELLLGDLLADLAPLAGETGKKESAQDVLARVLEMARSNANREASLVKECHETRKRADAAEAKVADLQAAMVTQRAPDAGAGAVLDRLGALLDNFRRLRGGEKREAFDMLAMQKELVEEWWALRSMLSPKQPMIAVAVRDDSTPTLAERYSLMVLRWDGAKLDFEMVDGPARPWVDLARPMRHAVDTKLVPSTFR